MRIFRRRVRSDPPSWRRANMFDSVRIVSSPETVEAGYADRTGTCFGFTTPSQTGVEVIGPGDVDDALNVAFEDGTAAWFDPSLVLFLDVNAGQYCEVGGTRFVRTPNGDWVKTPDSN